MTPERYQKAGEIYHAALDLPPDRRPEFLEQACAGDAALLSEVESLLAAHAAAGRFIEAAPEHVDSLLRSVLAPPSHDGGLTPGQQLGRYEVLGLLGAGGMGTVYRALDPTLGRQVAIKALAPTFRGDAASLRRFEREARVLATLSHPNIATIYGFEQLDGSPYLVLERVDGETLANRLARGSMSIEETLRVGGQVVEGLEEAHSKGIIHRDLKPSNVMLTSDGRVKLVDFGLAKPVDAPPRPDVPEPITASGVVIGTARYMSPEQVKGESVDVRTDVWAFGCVLYEMLAARPVFAGRSTSDVVAAVLRDEPDWQALPPGTPRNVHRLLRRCLRRDPRLRLQHIGDARLELVETADESLADLTRAPRASTRRRTTWLLAALLILALGALLLWRVPASPSALVPARLSLELPRRLALASEFSAPFAIAPAGSPVVFEAVEGSAQRLYVRELTDSSLSALPGTEGARQPFFSPDGRWIGFFSSRKLSKVPVSGGPVLTVADTGGNPRGATWAPDGTIVFAAPATSGLWRVAETGGKPTPLTRPDKARGESSHRWPDVLPDGKWVLFTVGFEDAPYDEGRIEAVSLEAGERRVLVSPAGFARYSGDGQLLFVRGGRLHAVGFDPERLEVRGTPEVVLDPVRYDVRNGGAHLAVSASGMVVYGPGLPVSAENYLAWADRDGQLRRLTDTPRAFRNVRASPDGRRVAAVIGTSTESDLWLVESNGTLSRLSFSLSPHRPTWTRKGDGITVGSAKDGVWRLLTVAADGTRDPTIHYESPHRVYPNAWSPDGRSLIFQESRPDTGWDLRVLAMDASGRPVGTPQAFANTPFDETSAAISSDGRWVSYESDELDGVVQIYIRSFPDGAHKVRASPSGARWPVWDADGNLHYWQTQPDSLQMVHTTPRAGQLFVEPPQAIWQGAVARAVLQRIVNPVGGARYDLEHGGRRFLVLEKSVDGSEPELAHPVVVLGRPRP
jgi:serine/threonine-protein kinase